MQKRKKRLILAYPNMRWQKDDIVTNWNLEPTALCLLDQTVREKVDVRIIDAQFEDLSRDVFQARVAEYRPDYVGLSLLTSEYTDALDIAAQVVKSVSREINEIVGKPIRDLERVPGIIKKIIQRGMYCIANFIIGFPGETWDEIRQTIAFAENCEADYVKIYPAVPLYGTKLFKWPGKAGP